MRRLRTASRRWVQSAVRRKRRRGHCSIFWTARGGPAAASYVNGCSTRQRSPDESRMAQSRRIRLAVRQALAVVGLAASMACERSATPESARREEPVTAPFAAEAGGGRIRPSMATEPAPRPSLFGNPACSVRSSWLSREDWMTTAQSSRATQSVSRSSVPQTAPVTRRTCPGGDDAYRAGQQRLVQMAAA